MPNPKHYSVLPTFDIGETVYRKNTLGTDTEKKGSVLWIELHAGDHLMYAVRWADEETAISYNDFELASDPYPKESEDE